MNLDGGRLVAKVLKKNGVKALFTLSGEHILPIYEGCLSENIEIIDTRHEAAAAHAADAYARLTRNIGVCAVTSGPGVTNAVTGVANAYFVKSPLVCLGGAAPLNTSGQGALQEMDQISVYKPITKWAGSIYKTEHIPRVLTHAIRIALTPPMGPVYIDLPKDILEGTSDATIPLFTISPYKIMPEERSLKKIVHLIEKSKKPVLLCGSEAYWDKADKSLKNFVEQNDMPTFLNGMARGMIPSDHPLYFNLCRKKAFQESDLIIIAGTPLDFRLKFGASIPSNVPFVMISNDPTILGQNKDPLEGLSGNLHLIFEFLSTTKKSDRKDWIDNLRNIELDMKNKLIDKAKKEHIPMSAFTFIEAFNSALDKDDIIIADGGEIVTTAAKRINLYNAGHWLDPGPMGCLGVGAPFAIAAKWLNPDKNIIILYGDGSFGLNGFEFDTALRFNLPIIGVVANDAQWTQVLQPQVNHYGRAVATKLLPTRYEKIVEGLGCYGFYVKTPEELIKTIKHAKTLKKPTLINVPIDPDVEKDDLQRKSSPAS
jgi:acetolactate synthase-1/2/3 large subunit